MSDKQHATIVIGWSLSAAVAFAGGYLLGLDTGRYDRGTPEPVLSKQCDRRCKVNGGLDASYIDQTPRIECHCKNGARFFADDAR